MWYCNCLIQAAIVHYSPNLFSLKKSVKIIIGIIGVILIAGLAWWEYNKKHIVKNAVEGLVSKKTDSLYYIHYDSSAIDAATGSASFYNVALQSDSLQKQLLMLDSASSNTIYNVHVAEVSISGVDIPSLAANVKIDANKIRIIRPVINIIEAGTNKDQVFNYNDTLALYEKLLGKFNSIHAAEIIIEDGQLNFVHKTEAPHISLSGINIHIKNVLINSTKNYDNLASYFIKDVIAGVKKVIVKDEENRSFLFFSDIEYNAFQKTLRLGNFQQMNNDSNKVAFNINNTLLKGLNTDSFILKKQLKAEELVSDGGLMTFYSKKNKDSTKTDAIEIDNNFFNEAQLNSIILKNTRIVVYNQDKPNNPPFILTNVNFSASDIQKLYSGTNIRNLIGRSNWNVSADGFSFITKDKIYKLSVGAFNMNKSAGTAHIDYFTVKPLMTEAAFVKNLEEENDLYDVSISNIDLTGIDTKSLIADRKFIAENAVINLILKISRDRTVPDFTGSRVGNYPHQLIQKLKFPVYIKRINAKDAYITYTERNDKSKKQGTVFFSKVNGTLDNVTNIKEYISKNNQLVVNATGKLLGAGALKTQWHLPLNTSNGAFAISGECGAFHADVLNPLIEPLAFASFKKGEIKAVDFTMSGNDNEAKGSSTLLYNDLSIEALKIDSNDLKKRELMSFVANLLVRNNNPQNGETRKGEIDVKRDTTRSFFNLVWQGIFKAAKRTALGKNDD